VCISRCMGVSHNLPHFSQHRLKCYKFQQSSVISKNYTLQLHNFSLVFNIFPKRPISALCWLFMTTYRCCVRVLCVYVYVCVCVRVCTASHGTWTWRTTARHQKSNYQKQSEKYGFASLTVSSDKGTQWVTLWCASQLVIQAHKIIRLKTEHGSLSERRHFRRR
jgi:hypothetical protein